MALRIKLYCATLKSLSRLAPAPLRLILWGRAKSRAGIAKPGQFSAPKHTKSRPNQGQIRPNRTEDVGLYQACAGLTNSFQSTKSAPTLPTGYALLIPDTPPSESVQIHDSP